MEIKELSSYSFGKEAEKIKEKRAKDAIRKPSFLQKNLSSLVDISIVFVVRFVIASILAAIWYQLKLKNILESIDFHTESSKIISILIQFGIIYELIIFATIVIFAGGIYYILFYASKKSATLGCILMDLQLVDKKTGERISLLRSFFRYLLCLMPFVFISLMAYKIYLRELDILVIILIVLSAFWYDLSIVLRINQGVPDVIMRTAIVSTRPPKKRSTSFNIFK